jgi:hypothetical protein
VTEETGAATTPGLAASERNRKDSVVCSEEFQPKSDGGRGKKISLMRSQILLCYGTLYT